MWRHRLLLPGMHRAPAAYRARETLWPGPRVGSGAEPEPVAHATRRPGYLGGNALRLSPRPGPGPRPRQRRRRPAHAAWTAPLPCPAVGRHGLWTSPGHPSAAWEHAWHKPRVSAGIGAGRGGGSGGQQARSPLMARVKVAALPATAWAVGFGRPIPLPPDTKLNGHPFPATASVEGAQLNAPPSLRQRRRAK